MAYNGTYINGRKIQGVVYNGVNLNGIARNGQIVFKANRIPAIVNINVGSQAQGAVATASSYLNASASSRYPAPNSNDANTTTYWQSNKSPTTSAPEWLQITFNHLATINQYYGSYGGTTRPTDYTLQYLDSGGNWVTFDTVVGNTSNTVTVNVQPITTTAVRWHVTKAQSSSVGCRILDISLKYVI